VRRLRYFCWFSFIGAIFLSGPGHAAAPVGQELRFAVVVTDVPAEMSRRLAPLMRYLAETLQRPVSLKLLPNMPTAIDQVSKGEAELAYLTPEAYIESHARADTQAVVKTVTRQQPSIRLTIVVRQPGPIMGVEGLKGKTIAVGDKAALLPRAVVTAAGIPPEQLGDFRSVGRDDNIAQGVLRGDFDAGVLRDTAAFPWEGKGLRVLYSSPALPPYNITASRKVDAKLLRQLQEALLRLDFNNPKHRGVIQALDREYDGFAPTSDAEYDLARRLIAPLAKR
jgi:phosphonate transport system substrate-binding protein